MRLRPTGAGFRLFALLVGAAAAAALAIVLPSWTAGREQHLVTIATGSRAGVYYYAGGSICGLVNARRWQQGIRCEADATAGSIANLRALRNGTADFAIVQSDWQDSAWHGTGVFAGVGPDADLRSVFAIYPESFTVIAAPESGIARFADLRGKRVNAGAPGSGSRATLDVVIAAMGWSEADFAHVFDYDGERLRQAVCDGEVDAAVFTIAHPNLAVEEMITSCDAVLVPVEAPGIERLIAAHPYYLHYAIPGDTYPRQPATVPVFALAATLVTTAATPPGVVQDVAADVFAALESFRARHPAFAEFSIEQMLTEGLTAPMHAGALAYFRQAGLGPGAGTPAPQ